MWQKAEVRKGTVRYRKHQRTRNSKPVPEARKERGNVRSTSKNAKEGLYKAGNAHKGALI